MRRLSPAHFQPLMLLLASILLCAGALQAAPSETIDQRVAEALDTFRTQSPAAAQLMEKAEAVLVFPNVTKMGFGIGGEYGEGSLLVKGKPVGYYSTAGASFGLQLGMQFKAQLIMFMDERSLRRFRRSNGWEVGVDGSVALATVGAGGTIDSQTAQQPIIGFVFSNKGLMYNLTLEGSKITPLQPDTQTPNP
jgi:lipid-binding SYLF domain-containing protein